MQNKHEIAPDSLFMSENDKLLIHEKTKWDEGFSFVAGIDEAGRGCCAGPVVAAAVVFTNRSRIPAGLNDSKQLNPKKRMFFREILLNDSTVLKGIYSVSAEEIDDINILKATWRAMSEALRQIPEVQFALVDGNPVQGLTKPNISIVKGDAKSASIAAASILAKTTRDLYMTDISRMYPQYKFEIHKGYCTKLHTDLIKKYGPCPIHRKTFEPVKSILHPPDLIQDSLL